MKLSLFLLMAAVFAAGCGSTDSSPLEEGGDERADGKMKDRSISEDGKAEARGDSSWKEDGPVDTGTDLGMDAPVDGGTMDAPDALTDTGGDVGADTRTDAPTDTGTDADSGGDGPTDTGADIGTDTGTDAPVDTGTDIGTDAPVDTGTQDTGSDTGTDVGSDTGTDTGTDAGCTISAADAGGALNWAKRFGTTGQTTPDAVAIDPSSGDVVVAGYFDGTVNFGGGLLTSHGDASTSGPDAFIARFNSNGKHKWAKDLGNGLAVDAADLAFAASGSLVVGGTFEGSLNLGCKTLTAVGTGGDLFLAMFDAAGNCTWSESFGVVGQFENITSVAVDSAGNALMGGVAYGGLDFGGGARTGYYIAKFDSTGAYVWSNAFAASSTESSPMLAVDPSGNMILAGSFATTVNFGGGTLTSAGSTDVFLAKFDSSGTYKWAKQYGDGSEQNPSGVAVDPCGNILIAGDLSGTINFGAGTGTLTAPGADSYVFLAKISPAGEGVWSEEFVGSPGALSSGSVAVDGAGGATITASIFSGTADFGGGSLSSVAGTNSVAMASFDAAGVYRWAYSGGAPSTAAESFSAQPRAVGTGTSAVVVAGGFGASGATLVLGGKTLTAESTQDVFVTSFSP